MLTLQEKLKIIENSNSLLELDKEVLPKVHRENYYFVSYSHKDYKKVMRDILLLQEEGINIWYDSDMHIGENWEELAEMYISKFQCKGIIFYLSENSILSKACNKEIEYVLENNKQFFSINIPLDDGTIYQSGLEMLLELKRKGKDINENLLSLFEKAFPNNLLYLSYFDDIERKVEQIKMFTFEDIFSIKYGLSDSYLSQVSRIDICKDNSYVKLVFKNNYQVNDENDDKNFGKFYPLGEIDKCTFANLLKLKEVTLPNNIIKLNDYAFANCLKLNKINIEDGNLILGNYVFSNCINLNIRKIKCKELGEGVFNNCKSIKHIDLYNELSSHLFDGCISLETVNINCDLYSIPNHSFAKCRSLKEIYINNERPNYIETIRNQKIKVENDVFAYCYNLESFRFIGNINIDHASGLFYYCKKLNHVIFDIGETNKIPNGMFAHCNLLENVYGLNNVNNIGAYAFKDCYKINEFDFSNVKSISEFAFFGTNFTEIILNNIYYIDNFAFANIDSLTKVIIGENIKLMNYQIFNNCKNLKYLEILGKDIELHETKTFEGVYPEIITICDLKVLRALVKYMEKTKIVYFEENLITIDEIKDITSLDFIKSSSDKAGFDMFIINKDNLSN